MLVLVSGRARRPPQRIPEHSGRLTGRDAAQLDAAVIQPAVRGLRGPEVDRSRYPPTRGVLLP
jgi:hypothetical protein